MGLTALSYQIGGMTFRCASGEVVNAGEFLYLGGAGPARRGEGESAGCACLCDQTAGMASRTGKFGGNGLDWRASVRHGSHVDFPHPGQSVVAGPGATPLTHCAATPDPVDPLDRLPAALGVYDRGGSADLGYAELDLGRHGSGHRRARLRPADAPPRR